MPSLLVRLRRRAISLTSSENDTQRTPVVDSAPPTNEPGDTATLRDPQPTPLNSPVSRLIVPDINALMDSYAAETPTDREGSQGLRLPRTRKRSLMDSIATVVGSAHNPSFLGEEAAAQSDVPLRTRTRSLLDSFTTAMGSSRDSEHSAAEAEEVQDYIDDNIFSSGMGDPGESSSRLSKYGLPRLSQFSSTGTWSTFGRQKKSTAPKLSRFTPSSSARHSRMGSVDSSAPPLASRARQGSVTSVNRYYASPSRMSSVAVSHSVPSTISRTSSRYEDHAPHNHSPPLTNSSRQNSMTQISASHSSPSHRSHPDSHSSNGVPKTGLESPRTFGNITPPPQRPGPRSSSLSPPPLPPLDHPALTANLTSRSRTTTHESSDRPRSRSRAHYQSYTFPRRVRRSRSRAATTFHDENVNPGDAATMGHSRGRSLRASSSLPQVRDMFPLLAPSPTIMTPRRMTSDSLQRAPRSRAPSQHTPSRRSSAEWSAHQATVGITSENIHEYGWPAEVSREMLRLSLGRDEEGFAEGVQRGRHVPEPHASSLSCFPSDFSPLSPPPPPPSSSFPPFIFLEGPSLHSRGDTLSTLRPENLPSTQLDHDGENSIPVEARFDSDSPRGVATDTSESALGSGLVSLVDDENRMSVQTEKARSRSKSNPAQQPAATLPRTSNSTRVPRRSILNSATPISEAGPSTPKRTSNALVTPKQHSALKPRRTSSEPGLLSVLETPTNQKGKRKAEEVDITPPDQKTGQRATFVIPENGRRIHHESESSHAPSSYQRKRVRLSATSPSPSPSRPGSSSQNPGTLGSIRPSPSPLPGYLHLSRTGSRATSTRSNQQNTPTPTSSSHDVNRRGTAERRSMSEMSIPISALIAPHAPSISRSSTYHMRDPRRPPAIRPTPWGLHFRSVDEDGSPLHAWCFFIGFILFPLWWIASFVPIPKTRHVGGTDTEKAVTLDDPQVEHDARSWRFRCRIMSGIAFFTYIPFIILVAIFVPR